MYDTIIVGGGSAGSVHGPQALRQECQQGPALRGGPGHAARQRAAGDSRQLFGHGIFRSALPLDRAQGHDPGRQPQQPGGNARRLRKYEQARGAGRRLIDQRPDWPIAARRPTTTNGKRAAPRAGAGRTCCPISGRSSATSISTDRSTARMAASRSAASRVSTGRGHSQAVGRGLQARRLCVPARPERRVRRRLFPGHALQPRPSNASRPRWAISIARRASAPI